MANKCIAINGLFTYTFAIPDRLFFWLLRLFVCLGDILFVSTVFLEKSYRFEWFHFVLEKTFQLKREQQDCEVRKKVGEFLGSK